LSREWFLEVKPCKVATGLGTGYLLIVQVVDWLSSELKNEEIEDIDVDN